MGGGGGSAQAAAQQQEAQRQAQIAKTTGAINSIFDNPARQQQYADYGKNLLGLYKQNLDYQQGNAARNLKFALARSGLTGGSYSADSAGNLQHDYNQGLLNIKSKASQGESSLEGADQQTRQNLIALAQSGLDATSAASMADSALQSNIRNAQQYQNVDSLGNFFGDVSDLYNKSLQNKQNNAVPKYGLSLYGQTPGSGAVNWTGGTPFQSGQPIGSGW